jgi:hypothetical protein
VTDIHPTPSEFFAQGVDRIGVRLVSRRGGGSNVSDERLYLLITGIDPTKEHRQLRIYEFLIGRAERSLDQVKEPTGILAVPRHKRLNDPASANGTFGDPNLGHS